MVENTLDNQMEKALPDKEETPVAEETPKTPELEETPETTPQAEKTADDEQIKSLQAQKEHWREKAEKAEEEARQLKLAKETSTSADTDLVQKFPDWDLMSETEKQLARDMAEIKEERAWQKDFARVKSEFKGIADNESEFRDFCYRPENIRIKDVSVLAKAFLFDKKPAQTEVKPTRKGLERPTGGEGKVDTSVEYTAEQIKDLRENHPKKFIKMLQQGRFDKVKYETP